MATMRDRSRFPPGQWQYIHPEAGQKEPWKGSFSEIVTLEVKFRAQNPALVAKHGWSLNLTDIENDVDAYNAQRMIAGGFSGFVDVDAIPPAPLGGTRRSPGGLSAAVGSAVTGLAIYRELFGHGRPVDKAQAEERAAICATCPKNRKVTFKAWFRDSVAKGLMELVGAMRDKDLTTSHDKQLGVCEACDCPLSAKVFVELPLILKHTTPDVRQKLDARCWILRQQG